MKHLIRMLWMAALFMFSGAAWPAQTFNGELTGSFTGHAVDGSGEYTGSISGQWTATGTLDASGVTVATVTGSGSFGGYGLAGSWTMASYDPLSKTIHVSWTAPGGRGPVSASGGADGSVSLVVDTARGVATGDFSGAVYTPAGTKTIAGTWTVQFQGAANATISGKVQGEFSGSASYVGNVAGSVTGDWTARVMPDGSVVGTASGSYDGGNIAVPGYGTICICGTWLANVTRGSDGQYQLEGGWTHPVVSGNLAGSGGGPLVWYLDLTTSPIQASGSFGGQVSFQVSIPMLGSMAVPISVSGNWTATLPLNP